MSQSGLSADDVEAITSGNGPRLVSEITALRDSARQQKDASGARYYEERRKLIVAAMRIP